jgi:hypothetical protein
MNIHIAQSVQARNELKRIANVKFQIIGVKDSNPIIGCKQDALSGAFLMTQKDVKIKGSDVASLLCNTSSESKTEIEMDKYYTGQEIFTHIIPKGVNSIKKDFQVKDGKLITGLLDKTSLSTAKNSLIQFIWDKHGPNKTRAFIDDAQKLVLNYLLQKGLTISFKDCILDEKFEEQIKKLLDNTVLENKYNLTQYENDIDQLSPGLIESTLNAQLNSVANDMGGTIRKTLDNKNSFWNIVSSGAKGSDVNLQQIMGCVGQMSIQGSRIMKKVEGRSLIYFHKDDDTPEARGFARSSLLDGLTGSEAFIFTMAGREGLIDTAIKSVTWETPIVIIENNMPVYTEIGKWIDKLLDCNKSEVKHYTDRQMELLDITSLNKVFIPTTDMDGNVSWGIVSAITRHDPGDSLYEIKTKGGRSVIVTESKSLLIWNKSERQFREMLTPDIIVGDCVPVTMDLCDPPVIMEYNGTQKLNSDYGKLVGQTMTEIPEYAIIAPKDFIRELLYAYIKINGTLYKNYFEFKAHTMKTINNISMLCSRFGVVGDMLRINETYFYTIDGTMDECFSECKTNINKNVNSHNNVVLDEIVEINLIDVKLHKKVYDLTIPSTLNFGLANGLQVRDTAQVGYIQRRLIKGLEDLSIKYDGTNRNSRNVIIQYVYGENGINQSKQTEIQLKIMDMDNKQLEKEFCLTTEQMNDIEKKLKVSKKDLKEFNEMYLEKMKMYRDNMRIIQTKATLNYKTMEDKFMLPVNLFRLTQDYMSDKKDIIELSPQQIVDSIENFLNSPEIKLLPGANKGNIQLKNDDRSLKYILEIALYEYLSPVKCIFTYGLTETKLKKLWSEIKLAFIKAIAEPGEMVGILAAQSIGEPITQLNLNTKHFAGVASKSGAASGVPRITELLAYSKNIKTPQITIYFNDMIRSNK